MNAGVNGQRLEHSLDVDFRSVRNAYAQFWNLQANEVLYKVQDFLSWSWRPIVGTLIQCVHNDENWFLLSRDCEHFLETVDQDSVARLLRSFPVCRIKSVDDIAARF